MTISVLSTRLGVEVSSLREGAERGDEDAVYDVARAAVSLGVADHEIEARLSSGEEMSGTGLWDAVRRFLTSTTLSDRTRTAQHWRWPIFVIGCPDAEKAQTDVSIASQNQRDRGVSLKLFGAGFEDKTTLTIADTVVGSAAPGQTRILFAGHDVEVVEFDLVRGGRVISQGTRIELVGTTGVVGWIDLATPPSWLLPASKLVSLHYGAARPDSQQQWSREVSYAHSFQLVLGADLKPLELGATLSYALATTVTLRVTLPGGGDWDVVKPDRCAGMTVVAAGK